MGIIYGIRNTLTNKIYIGQTIQPSYLRWSQHLRNITKQETLLQKDMLLLGWQNFEFKIIEEVDDDTDLNEREYFWIEYFGGVINCYNNIRPKNITVELKELKSLVVCQYDLSGKFINYFKNGVAAATALFPEADADRTSVVGKGIMAVVSGKRHKAYGFHWKKETLEQVLERIPQNNEYLTTTD